eukprot:403924_1
MSSIVHADLSVFKQEDKINGLKCNDKDDYTKCQAMHRLFAALSYYSKLNIIENTNDRELFDRFYNEIYDGQFINDYIHFNNDHSHQIEDIESELTSNNQTCDISKCLFTFRQHKQVNQ